MEDSSGWKLFQKRIYDILSHRHGTIIVICGCVLVIVSAFQFGETFLEWSEEKYATVFNSFSDNIAGRSYRKRLCLPVPIDVVYTWVNGTDPKLIYELRKHKDLMEQKLNQTHKHSVTPDGQCSFPNCVPTTMLVIDPPLPSGLTKDTLGIVYPWLKPAVAIYPIPNPENQNLTVTVVEFDAKDMLLAALNETILVNGKNTSIKRAYYTSDWTIPNSVLQPTLLLMTGFPQTFTDTDLTNYLPKKYSPFVEKVEIHKEKGIAVITMTTKEECDKFLEDGNVTIEGKQQQLSGANLVWDLRDYSLTEDVAANRFEDNEELRYSLRSIEQYAPWVRQIFIVTNGQLPFWLNLDNPRLTLVTHEELFENKSHLPSFSSPAIESHIHKIPGLSDRFIYMNDDVMFGREVWPDDFYTHSKGQKIYLTWPVPNCQDGCPSSWIKDGYCDKACNNSECDWDGGDCKGGAARNQGAGWGAGGGWGQDNNEALYCNSGCANNWLADKYCDQACNVRQCGFDAGDCGTTNYDQLHEIKLNTKQTHYFVPPGENLIYLNVSVLLGPSTVITDGRYDDKPVLRSVAIAQKFKVVTVVLHSGHNATKLNFTLFGKESKDATDITEYNFTLSVDTKHTIVASKEKPENDTKKVIEEQPPEKVMDDLIEKFEFEGVPLDLRSPRAKRVVGQSLSALQQVNMTLYMLPEDIEQIWLTLQQEHTDGLLTDKGFRIRQASLWEVFSEQLKSEGKAPMKRDLTLKAADKPSIQHIPMDGVQNYIGAGVNQGQVNLQEQAEVKKGDVGRQGFGQNGQDLNPNYGQNGQQPQALDQNYGQNLQGLNPNYGQNGQQPQALDQNYGQNLQGLNQNFEQNARDLNQNFDQNVQGLNQNFGQNAQGLNQNFEQNAQALNQNFGQNAQDGNLHYGQNPQKLPRLNADMQQGFAMNQNLRPDVQIAADLGQNVVQNPQARDHNLPQKQDFNQNMDQNLKIQKNDENYLQPQQYKNIAEINQNIGQAQQAKDGLAGQVGHDQVLNQDAVGQGAAHQPVGGHAIDGGGEKIENQEDTYRSRKLNGFDNGEGLLPWEKDGTFSGIQKKLDQIDTEAEYETSFKRRKLLDKFSDSLRFVNKLYNTEYGFTARKVPAHMPHMIDRNIMTELQDKFPKIWDATSSHQVRHSQDMQFAFSYFYYVMSEPNHFDAADVFDAMDTDNSGILSDREIRTLATRLYDLPLDLPTLTGLEHMLTNCSKHLPPDPQLEFLLQEQYYDPNMPQVTKTLFVHCPAMSAIVKKKFQAGTKYRHEVVSDDTEVLFKMIRTNVSSVVGQLDDIRKNPKKFICLNDNIDHNTEQSKTVKAVLQDFYESIFPIASSFELPREYRNRFLHIDELREWRRFRDWLKTWTQIALCLLIIFTVGSFFSDKLEALQRRVFGRRHTAVRAQNLDV